MDPAFHLLLACARTSADPQRSHRTAELIRAGIDWHLLLTRARQHGLLPLVYHHLQPLFREIPSDVTRQLEDAFRLNAGRNLALTQELFRVCEMLQRQGVEAIAMKGPVLALTAYANVSHRMFVDLDILIRAEDYVRAVELLQTEGYSPAYVDAEHVRILRAFGSEQMLTSASSGIRIDLHWRLLPPRLSYALDAEALWGRSAILSLARRSLRVFSREDQMLFACVHGSKHSWTRLAWIRDVAGLSEAHPPIDWSLLLSRSDAAGSTRMVLLGLTLAKDLLGVQLPSEVCVRMRADRIVVAAAAEVRGRLPNRNTEPDPVTAVIQHLRLTTGISRRFHYVSRLLTGARPEDAGRLRLPFLVHSALRPGRLLVRWLIRPALHRVKLALRAAARRSAPQDPATRR